MKKGVIAAVTVLALGAFAANVLAAEAKAKGEDLFKAKCAACHPDGGNVMNAKKTLKKKDLAASADEPVERNFVRKHALRYQAQHGCDEHHRPGGSDLDYGYVELTLSL